MKKLNLIFMSVLVLGIGFSSCKKKTAAPVQTTPATPKPYTPAAPSGYDGVFVAVKMTFSYPMVGAPSIPGMPNTVDIDADVASVAVANGRDFNNLIDAGAVTLNTFALDKASNNVYTKMGMVGLTPSSLNFPNVTWNASNLGISNFSPGGSFPTFDLDGIPTEVNRANDLTLNLSANTGGTRTGYAILIAAGDKQVLKLIGNVSSITISKSELAALPAVSNNTAILQVCPYTVDGRTFGGKNYYFVKEAAAIRFINIK